MTWFWRWTRWHHGRRQRWSQTIRGMATPQMDGGNRSTHGEFPTGLPPKNQSNQSTTRDKYQLLQKKTERQKVRAWNKVQFSWVVTLDDRFFLDELCDPIVKDFQKVESEVSNKSAVSCWKLAIFSASRLLDHRCCDEYSLHHLFWFKDKDSSNFLNSVYVFLLQLDIYFWTSITTLHKSLLDLAFAMFSAFFLGQFLLSDSSHRWSGQVSLPPASNCRWHKKNPFPNLTVVVGH